MAISAVAAIGIATFSALNQMDEARRARHTAEDEAKRQQEALAKLQATPTPEMPVADSVQVDAAKRRSIVSQMGRRGRASTILTDNPDALGGG